MRAPVPVCLALIAVITTMAAAEHAELDSSNAGSWVLKSASTSIQQLADEEDDDAAELESALPTMLLNHEEHKKQVKASYQGNVKTIYFHLEEIIRKIVAHKTKWTKKYKGDLTKIQSEVDKHKGVSKSKKGKFISETAKRSSAKATYRDRKKSWGKAKNRLKQKMRDAKKMRKALKALYLKGLKQKKGEICMIRRIECMVAKFNKDAKLKARYCGKCSGRSIHKSPASKSKSLYPSPPGQTSTTHTKRECARSLFLHKTDYHGSDLRKGFVIKGGAMGCCKACLKIKECEYWTYGTDNKKCYVKHSSTGKESDRKRVAGSFTTSR